MRLDLDVELARIDRSWSRAVARASSAIGLSAVRAVRADGAWRLDLSSVESALLASMRASHLCAVERVEGLRRFGREPDYEASDDEVRRILSSATKDQRAALDKFYGSIARSVTKQTAAQVKRQLMSGVAAAVGDKDEGFDLRLRGAFGPGGPGKKASPVLKTVFRTQTAMAFNAGTWVETEQDEDVWGYEYATAGDERVRPSHEELDGVRYPRDHEFWRTAAPPNGWNCRCGIDPIYDGEKRAKTKPFKGTPDIDPEFRMNYGALFEKVA